MKTQVKMYKSAGEFNKDASKMAKKGWTVVATTATAPAPSKHKSHGILWKATHPVGATLGAARFVGSTVLPSDKGTITATYQSD
jgi:hypothetical protein